MLKCTDLSESSLYNNECHFAMFIGKRRRFSLILMQSDERLR